MPPDKCNDQSSFNGIFLFISSLIRDILTFIIYQRIHDLAHIQHKANLKKSLLVT